MYCRCRKYRVVKCWLFLLTLGKSAFSKIMTLYCSFLKKWSFLTWMSLLTSCSEKTELVMSFFLAFRLGTTLACECNYMYTVQSNTNNLSPPLFLQELHCMTASWFVNLSLDFLVLYRLSFIKTFFSIVQIVLIIQGMWEWKRQNTCTCMCRTVSQFVHSQNLLCNMVKWHVSGLLMSFWLLFLLFCTFRLYNYYYWFV